MTKLVCDCCGEMLKGECTMLLLPELYSADKEGKGKHYIGLSIQNLRVGEDMCEECIKEFLRIRLCL